MLKIVAANLPFEAEAISADKLREKREKAEIVKKANMNPVTYKYLVQNNILNCNKWTTSMDKKYFGRCV